MNRSCPEKRKNGLFRPNFEYTRFYARFKRKYMKKVRNIIPFARELFFLVYRQSQDFFFRQPTKVNFIPAKSIINHRPSSEYVKHSSAGKSYTEVIPGHYPFFHPADFPEEGVANSDLGSRSILAILHISLGHNARTSISLSPPRYG